MIRSRIFIGGVVPLALVLLAGSLVAQERHILSVVYDAAGEVDKGILATGEVWTTLPEALGMRGEAVSRDDQGRVLVAGTIQSADVSVLAVARYLPTGQLDTSFGELNGLFLFAPEDFGSSRGYDILFDPRDERVVVVGEIQTISGVKFVIVKLTPDGHLDADFGSEQTPGFNTVGNGFGSGNESTARAVTMDGQGRYVVAGHMRHADSLVDGEPRSSFALARFRRGGKRDMTFESAPYNGVVVTTFPPAPHARAEDIGIVQLGAEERIVAGVGREEPFQRQTGVRVGWSSPWRATCRQVSSTPAEARYRASEQTVG